MGKEAISFKQLPERKRALVTQLRRTNAATAGDMLASIQKARDNLRGKILNATVEPSIGNDRFRETFYGRVTGIYDALAVEMDNQLRGATRITADTVRAAALTDIKDAGGRLRTFPLRFDETRLANYWRTIAPENGPSLASVFSNKMGAEQIGFLRQAVTETFRQADLEAWTARERIRELQRRWDGIAGDLVPNRFLDKSGKAWPNAQYTQMLVRTTQARVHREAYIDTVVENGDELMIIVAVGDNCKTCAAWDGIIISVTGKDKRFPSYADAIGAGMFHPNCDCTMSRADEAIHAKDITAQGKAKTPPEIADPDTTTPETNAALAGYREEAGLPPPEPGDGVTDFSDAAAEEFRKALRLKKR